MGVPDAQPKDRGGYGGCPKAQAGEAAAVELAAAEAEFEQGRQAAWTIRPPTDKLCWTC